MRRREKPRLQIHGGPARTTPPLAKRYRFNNSTRRPKTPKTSAVPCQEPPTPWLAICQGLVLDFRRHQKLPPPKVVTTYRRCRQARKGQNGAKCHTSKSLRKTSSI